MTKNVGKTDKIIRLILSVVFGVVALSTTGTIQIIASVAAFAMLVTALLGTCMLYKPFGINTCKIK